VRSYDLIVLGAGSGNTFLTSELAHLRTAIVEPDRFGGTCLNRGCIPSKMYVVAADVARSAQEAHRLGVQARLDGVDWPAVRERIFSRIDPIHEQAMEYRRANGIDVYTSSARFVGPRVLEVDGEQLTADRVVVAVGARPVIPDIPGLDTVPFHTSDTVMRMPQLPASTIVIGGGFIAAEFGHVLQSFGSQVTIVQRGPRLLMAEDEAVSARYTELASRYFRVLLEAQVTRVAPGGAGVVATVRSAAGETIVEAEMLLVATGRRPNTDLVDAAAGGLEVDQHGHLVADEYFRTAVPGVWAFGDSSNHFQLKHMANAEGRVVTHNVAHPEAPRRLAHKVVPHAVFGEPQIAAAGLTEQAARERGIEHVIAQRAYSRTAYGWALEDHTSFVKLVVDPRRRTLLGAHIIGPAAAILIQPLLQAMAFDQTVDAIARDVLYIHPALTEVVEQALLEVP
jgi:mycothione reductase